MYFNKIISKWIWLRVIIFIMFVTAFSVQVYLYVHHETMMASYTPVSEDDVYCVPPVISKFKHKGGGLIYLQVNNNIKKLIVKNYRAQISNDNGNVHIEMQLNEGFNAIQLEVDGELFTWNVMYNSAIMYGNKMGLSENFPGVLGLYPSSICMAKPVLAIEDWSPSSDEKGDAKDDNSLHDKWVKIFIDAIKMLENVRGIPDSKIENDNLEGVVERLEQRTSQGWCSQIALYTVAKLDKKIPVRLVSSSGFWVKDQSTRTGGHVFLEYIDPKTNRWALADPTNYIMAVRSQNGYPLNTIELDRVFSLPDTTGIDSLNFDMVDIKSNKIVSKKFINLDPLMQRDIKFYFRPVNKITYYSGSSSIYEKTAVKKISDWVKSDRRFILSRSNDVVNVAYLRLFSFWLSILGILLIVLGEFFWLRSNWKFNELND